MIRTRDIDKSWLDALFLCGFPAEEIFLPIVVRTLKPCPVRKSGVLVVVWCDLNRVINGFVHAGDDYGA
jgi:hypothetical protein